MLHAQRGLLVGAVLAMMLDLVLSLPRRPPSPGKILGMFNRPWGCGDCYVDLIFESDKHTAESMAWCVGNCNFVQFWNARSYNTRQRNENFLVVVNRWIQERINDEVSPASQVCGHWLSAADEVTSRGRALPLPQCPSNCLGPPPRQQQLSMETTGPCVLPPGHVSVTPVQIVEMEVDASTSFAGDVGIRRLLLIPLLFTLGVLIGTAILIATPAKNPGTQTVMADVARDVAWVFGPSAWQMPDATSNVCSVCTGTDASCIRRNTVQLTDVDGLFQARHIPHVETTLIFGTVQFATEMSEKQLKKEWEAWNRAASVHARIEHGLTLPGSVRPCPSGVTSACLQNRGAASGRYCDFRHQCLSRHSLFGGQYVQANPDPEAHFMLRGRASFTLQWYADAICGSRAGEEVTHGPSRFTRHRHSFQILVPEQCDTCATDARPPAPSVRAYDAGSGEVACEACAAMDVIRAVGTRTALCNAQVFQMQCEECGVNSEPGAAVSPYGVAMQCLPCRGTRDALGRAKGSHRPLGEVDCRNCSASSFFNGVVCQRLSDMVVQGDREVSGTDSFKLDEYTQAVVSEHHFRNQHFLQQPCTCNNRHKYTQFCGGYAVRDQDAWMQPAGRSELRQLSHFAAGEDLQEYAIRREGLCRACRTCLSGEYNGVCGRGVEGRCAACLALSSCPASPPHYLDHPHELGCNQLHALVDYSCARCKVWEKIGNNYMLLVGCGRQDLRRWEPSGAASAEVLEVVTCAFGGSSSAPCMHGGAQLVRREPNGNYSSLLPYCPPGWFFSCANSGVTVFDAFSSACCTKCRECPPEAKKTGLWAVCTGMSDTDTQASQCTDRCENNMYEEDGTCLYCNTCKEGEL